MHGYCSIFDNSAILAQPPTFFLIIYRLILIIKVRPKWLLKLIFNRLMILHIRNRPFGIHFAWIREIYHLFTWIFNMNGTEIYLEVFGWMKLIVWHLDLNPRAIEPSYQGNSLFFTVGVRDGELSISPHLVLQRPLRQVGRVGHQFYLCLQYRPGSEDKRHLNISFSCAEGSGWRVRLCLDKLESLYVFSFVANLKVKS